MKNLNNLSKVVIVGRMNVGKSTLFNRLSSSVKSIIFDYPGVTRDIIKDVVEWDKKFFELIDTGGVSLKKTSDKIAEEVRLRALAAVESAEIVIFLCDAKAGVLQEDIEISNYIRKTGKKIFLVANKMDNPVAQDNIYQFQRLGYKDVFYISADHGKGIAELLEAIAANIPEDKKEGLDLNQENEYDLASDLPNYDNIGLSDLEKMPLGSAAKKECKVAIIGKPNVGKSSLLNKLLQTDRAIVSDVPGTTREPIKERINFSKGDIQISDTAGVRRKRSVEEDLEKMMVRTSFKALKDANLVLLVVDSSEKFLSDQELKLAFYAFDNYKALILLFNKQDLVDQDIRNQLDFNLEKYDYFTKKIEMMNISCKSGKNVQKVLDLVNTVFNRHSQRFANDELTMLFKNALEKKPLHHKTAPLIVYAVKQIAVAPITFLVIVNVPEWFGQSQLGFFENLMRSNFDLKSAPIRFILRKRG